MRGICSPGPGAYDVQGGRWKAVPGLGDAPTFPFGAPGGEGASSSGAKMLEVPGPGTYKPKEVSRRRGERGRGRGETMQGLGDAPTFPFGAPGGKAGSSSGAKVSEAPGAGTYNPKEVRREMLLDAGEGSFP